MNTATAHVDVRRGYFVNRTLAAVAATLLTAAWMAAAQPAHAGEVEVASQRVSYSDLDVRSDAGARRLYQRLRRASMHVCDGADRHSVAWRECFETALADAVNSVGAPKVVALHRAHDAARSG